MDGHEFAELAAEQGAVGVRGLDLEPFGVSRSERLKSSQNLSAAALSVMAVSSLAAGLSGKSSASALPSTS